MDLAEIAASHVDGHADDYVNLAIGVLAGGRRHIVGDGIFRIASISKIFTALAYADSVCRDEVELDAGTPLADPAVTLRHLATHTSGLASAAWVPDADTVDELFEGVRGIELAAPPGELWAYSNLGATLLSHAVARRAGADYEELVRERIARPLGLTDTVLDLSPEQAKRLRPGHTETFAPARTPTLPVYAGSGGFHSTVEDLLTLLAAHVAAAPGSPYALVQQRTTGYRDGPAAMGLGWLIDPLPDTGVEVLWHNGALPGYRSYAGFIREAGLAAVVLTNTSRSVDDIGRRILADMVART
jgi:CubicO group peptidase (beta-lactamase class C family)